MRLADTHLKTKREWRPNCTSSHTSEKLPWIQTCSWRSDSPEQAHNDTVFSFDAGTVTMRRTDSIIFHTHTDTNTNM